MTRFAFAGKCNGLTAPLDDDADVCPAAASLGPSSEFNATTPSPAAPRPRNVRRLISRTNFSFMPSIPRDQFMQVQHRARDRGDRGESNRIRVLRHRRRLAAAEKRAGARRIGGKAFEIAFVEAAQNRALFTARRAIEGAIEHPGELRVEAWPARPDSRRV